MIFFKSLSKNVLFCNDSTHTRARARVHQNWQHWKKEKRRSVVSLTKPHTSVGGTRLRTGRERERERATRCRSLESGPELVAIDSAAMATADSATSTTLWLPADALFRPVSRRTPAAAQDVVGSVALVRGPDFQEVCSCSC